MNSHAEHAAMAAAFAKAGCPECAAFLVDGVDRWIVEREIESAVVVQIIRLSSGQPSAFDGRWLVTYEPTRDGVASDGGPMTAHITTTADRDKARRFANFQAACVELSQPSGRTRADGMPDRPLTAFTLKIERALLCP
jgi:hypothetical protein